MIRRFTNRIVHVFCRQISVLVLTILLLACGAPEPTPSTPATEKPDWLALQPDDYPRFVDNDSYEGLAAAIANSLLYLRRLPTETTFELGVDSYSSDFMIQSLEVFDAIIKTHPTSEELNRVVRQRFKVYRIGNEHGDHRSVLFTGYYEPFVPASPIFSAEFPIPLHSRPSDLIDIDLGRFDPQWRGQKIVGRLVGTTIEPYPEREKLLSSIDLNQIAPPIAWVQNEFDRFNLQVQGSGKVQFSDGRQLNVHFAATNGRPYRSIGRLLIDQGHIKSAEMSMQAIRDYLNDHPEQTTEILNYNPRYVFFKSANHPARGALGVSLTQRRSLAADRQIFPLGGLAFINVPLPNVEASGKVTGWDNYNGFVLIQDTGSAITGPDRADFFYGSGFTAESAAGRLKNEGRLFYLVLRPQNEAD